MSWDDISGLAAGAPAAAAGIRWDNRAPGTALAPHQGPPRSPGPVPPRRRPIPAGLSMARDGLTLLIGTSWCKCVPGDVRAAQLRAHLPPHPGMEPGAAPGEEGASTDLLRLPAGMVQVEQEDVVFCSHHQPGPVFIHQKGLEIHPIPRGQQQARAVGFQQICGARCGRERNLSMSNTTSSQRPSAAPFQDSSGYPPLPKGI